MFEPMIDSTVVLQQGSGAGAVGAVVLVAILLVALATWVAKVAGRWKTFEKAGEPGWAAVVPVYNIYVMMKVAGRPGWWTIMAFVPLLALLPLVQAPHDIAKKFDKGIAYSVGLVFLPFVFYPMLGFGDATYGGGQRGGSTSHHPAD